MPAIVLSDNDDSDDVLLLNDFDGEENDESIEAIQAAIDQMGVEQSDFEMAVNSGSEYAYLLAGSEDEKKRAESVIQQVHISLPYLNSNSLLPPNLAPHVSASTDGHGQQAS